MTDVIRKPWRPLLMILPKVSSKRLEAGRDDESFFNEDEDAEDEVVGEDDVGDEVVGPEIESQP